MNQALGFAIFFTLFFLSVFPGTFAFVNFSRKILRKGYRRPIAILVAIAGCLFGLVVAGLLGYSLGQSDAFNSEHLPVLSFAAVGSLFVAAAVSGVALVAGIATLLPNRDARIAGERTEWKRDQKLAYRLAAFFLAAIAVLILWRPNLNLDTGLFGPILLLGFLAGYFFVVARSLAKRAAAARYLKSSQTSETPVLYLREFEWERRPFALRSEQPRHPALQGFLLTAKPTATPLTLEEYLSPALESGLAPLVALGCPDDYFPPYGAARDYVGDQVWHERFKDLAVRSKAILLLPGSSKSLTWELGFLLSKGLASKLFLVFGPIAFSHPAAEPKWIQKLTGIVSYEALDWSRFVAATRAAGYNLAPRAPTPPAVIAFDPKGNSFELPGAFRTPEEYVRAIKARLNQETSGTRSGTCPECNGSGHVTQMVGAMKFNLTCPRCGGKGRLNTRP